MHSLKTFILGLILFLAAVTGPACDPSTAILPNLNIFSDQDDIKLGDSVVTVMLNDPAHYPMLTGANAEAIKNYISGTIIGEILKSNVIEKNSIYNYQSKIHIINDDSTMNAFALPGGPIFIYSGILKYLPNEAALAGVLGHEIAHAERRHASTRMTQQMGISVLLQVVLGQSPSTLMQIAGQLFTGLAVLQNSRANEDEADLYSFKYLSGSKYYPGSVKFFFEKMRDDGLVASNSGSVATFLSTHPDPIARISSTDSRLTNAGVAVQSYNVSGPPSNYFTNEYLTNIKSKLP